MNKLWIVLGLLVSGLTYAAIGESEKQELVIRNILQNPGFENGKFAWSASGGTFTVTTTAANVAYGNAAASWDSNGAAQTFQNAIAIPPGLYGRNATLSCLVKTASGTATHTLAAYDGSNTLASQTVVSSSTYAKTEVNFIMPSSGTIYARFSSVAADEVAILVDQCVISAASNISNVSQAQFIGSAYIPTVANCTWSRTSTSFGAFTADTDCGGPTVEYNPGPGTIQTTDADLPRFTVNNLPPGYYEVSIETSQGTTENVNAALAISDGSTTSGATSYNTNAGSEVGHYVKGFFSYTSAGNRSFELYGRSTGTMNVVHTQQAGVAKMNFSIKRYPSASEVAYNPSQIPVIWSGYQANDCAWSRTNTGYGDFTADASCTSTFSGGTTVNVNAGTISAYGSTLPGFTFTPKIVGTFKACAEFGFDGQGATIQTVRITDGTNVGGEAQISDSSRHPGKLCLTFSTSSLAAVSVRLEGKASSGAVAVDVNSAAANSVYWSLEQMVPQFANPQIVNSVVSPSSGGTRVASAYFTNSGSCAVSSQDGSWVSGVTDPGLGQCGIIFTAGTFSSAPACVCSGDGVICAKQSGVSITTSGMTVATFSHAGTDTDAAFSLICIGAK